MPSILRAFTVTTSTFDPPTHRDISSEVAPEVILGPNSQQMRLTKIEGRPGTVDREILPLKNFRQLLRQRKLNVAKIKRAYIS